MEEFNKSRIPDELEDDSAEADPKDTPKGRLLRAQGFSSLFSRAVAKENDNINDKKRRDIFPVLGGLFEKDEVKDESKDLAKDAPDAQKEDQSTIVAPEISENSVTTTMEDSVEPTIHGAVDALEVSDADIEPTASDQPEGSVPLRQTQEGEIWTTAEQGAGDTDADNLEGSPDAVVAEEAIVTSAEVDTEADEVEPDTPAPIIPPLPASNPNNTPNTPPPSPTTPPVVPPIPTPPPTPNTGPNLPPPPPNIYPGNPLYNPNNNPNNPNPVNPNIPVTPNTAPQVPEKDEKKRRSSGLLPGLVVGFLIGRHGKKELKKTIKNNEKTLKEQADELKRLSEEQRKEKERLSALAIKAESQKPKDPEKPAEVLKRVFLTSDIAKDYAPNTVETRARVRYEVDERGRLTIERDADVAKESIKPAAEAVDTYAVPDDRRVEMSSWHRIELDKKTGQIVESPSLEYGKEFKYEQQQEKMKQDNTRQIGSLPVGFAVGGTTSPTHTQDDTATQKSITNNVKKEDSAMSYLRDMAKTKTKDLLQSEPVTQLAVPFLVATTVIFFILMILYILFAL